MTNMRRRDVLITLLLGAPSFLAAQPKVPNETLTAPEDLRLVAASIVANHAPWLVLFSTPGCPYCKEVRRNYLTPRMLEQARSANPDLLLGEIDITSQRPIIDLAGRQVTQAAFATGFGVRAVPVVTLLDQAMRLLAEPLVGLDRSGFYEGYLVAAIEGARKRMRQTS
ncbi:MAG: thioredoxin fold domain-containing protein [Burkholderiaceae bacterium]